MKKSLLLLLIAFPFFQISSALSLDAKLIWNKYSNNLPINQIETNSNSDIIFTIGRSIRIFNQIDRTFRFIKIDSVNSVRKIKLNESESKIYCFHDIKGNLKSLRLSVIDFVTGKIVSSIQLEYTSNKLKFVDVSFDNKYIVGLDNNKQVYIWDFKTGSLISLFSSSSDYWAYNIYLSPKKNVLVAAQEKKMYLYDLDSGKIINSFKSSSYKDMLLTFTNNDSLLAEYDRYGYFLIYNYYTGEVTKMFNIDIKELGSIHSADFVLNDSLILYRTYSGIGLYDLKFDSNVKTILTKIGMVTSSYLEVNKSKSRMLLGGEQLKVYDFPNLNQIDSVYDFLRSSETSTFYNFSSDDKKLNVFTTYNSYMSPSNDYYSLDIASTQFERQLGYVNDSSSAFQFLSKLDLIALSYKNKITLFNTKESKYDQVLSFNDTITELKLSEDIKYATYRDISTNVWKVIDLNNDLILFEQPDNSYGFYFSETGKYFHSYEGNDKMNLVVRETQNGNEIFRKNEIESNGSFFSKDDKYFFNLIDKYYIKYSLETGDSLQKIPINENWTGWPIILTKDLKYFIESTNNGMIEFFDMDSMKVTKRFGGDYDYPIVGFVLSHDEKKIAIQFQDNSLFLYSLDTTTSIDNPNTLDVRSIEISPNPAIDFIEISNINPMLKHGVEYSNIKIFNLYGQNYDLTTKLSISGEGVRIDVSGLAPGMYFVRIGEKLSKFVKL